MLLGNMGGFETEGMPFPVAWQLLEKFYGPFCYVCAIDRSCISYDPASGCGICSRRSRTAACRGSAGALMHDHS